MGLYFHLHSSPVSACNTLLLSAEVIYTIAVAPFLRCRSKITPAIQPEFYEDQLDAKEAKNIYASMGYTLKLQLKALDDKGLLDWGAAESKVKGLLGRFQSQ